MACRLGALPLHPVRVFVAGAFVFVATCQAQVPASITAMAHNEVTARLHPVQYAYISEERSARTGMHLWRERVVEVGHSSLHRLIAVDGKPLDADATRAETERLRAVAADELAYWRNSDAHKDDEKRLDALLNLLPRAFLLRRDGMDGDCLLYRFSPNPAFVPRTMEERVGAAMEGTVSLRTPMNRLCSLEARLQRNVTFGFGLLGTVDSGGRFRLDRQLVYGNEWKSDRIVIHLGGRVLLLKTIAKDQETVRTHLRAVPQDLTVAQALQYIQP